MFGEAAEEVVGAEGGGQLKDRRVDHLVEGLPGLRVFRGADSVGGNLVELFGGHVALSGEGRGFATSREGWFSPIGFEALVLAGSGGNG